MHTHTLLQQKMSIETPRPGISLKQLHMMIFIFNAVEAGWSVRKKPETGNYLFKKRLETPAQRRVYTSDSFLQRFVQNMQRLDSALPSPRELGELEEVSSFELHSDEDVVLPPL